ncbi:MAG: Sulphatase-modifying factor protein [Bacteroidota bacterium]|nr:Sulphatase-modifying factor protein [Bacteroidota bacterium]
MKNPAFVLLALLFCGSVFGQAKADGSTPHGKAAKETKSKAQPLDPKLAVIVKEIEARMLPIEGGSFTMGCINPQDTECYYWEKPRHTVTITTFYMSKFDVTQKQWKAIMGTTPGPKTCPECPVINVSWFDAGMFINKLNQLSNKNYRLPTEAEWEYAAKGGNKGHGFKYSGGDNAMNVAWYDSVISRDVHPVGEKQANELGLFDISGNVWQWCSDWFDEKYYGKSPSNNPSGPPSGEGFRVVRGGSWWGPLKDCRVANRDKYPPDSKDDDVGFRLVRN